MTNDRPDQVNWIVRWVYTREEWQHFERWNAKHKGFLHYMWHVIFFKDRHVHSIEFNEQWIKVSDKQKYFNGPVTELRRVNIYDRGQINVLNITYENISNNQLNEINIPIPRGKLKEAVDAHEKLMKNKN